MSEHDAFDRVLAAVHDATLDESRWPATSALIDEACGLTGNGLMVAEGPTNDVRALFVGLYARGQRRDDLEREYLTTYHPLDERVPRFRQLPARRLVHITDLYTAEELKTSRTYNELLPRAGMQDSLNVQLPGLAGSHIGWGLNDPVDAEGWGAARITMIERLLPHIQQFVRVRQVLAGAGALGASLADLLATTGLGIIQLDGRGRIAAANDRALALLRTGEGLVDKGGALGADVPADDAVLQGLLTRALPPFGGPGAGGSMTMRRAADPLPLVVHLLPLGRPEPAACTWPVAAVVAVVDPARRPRLDPALVAAGLGLTPMESRGAVLLTEGKSLREVAAETGRQETTIRWHLRQAAPLCGPERERVAWKRAEERWEWEQLQRRRGKALGELEKQSKREWSALYGRHQQQREYLAKDCRGALGRFRLWRELGGKVREIGGAIRGDKEVLGRFRAELEDRLRWQRVSLGKEHSEAVRGIESKAGEFYRGGLEESEKRAREAARSDGLLLDSYRRPDEFYRLKYSMLEERLEQVREIDGELAYEKMRRAVEKASQEKARQVERARLEWDRQETARQSRERRGPERGGPERDFGPSR